MVKIGLQLYQIYQKNHKHPRSPLLLIILCILLLPVTATTQSGYETTGWSLDHPGWGGLTFRRPPLCAGDPISGYSGNLPVYNLPTIPVAIEAENLDVFSDDGEGHTCHDTTSGNSGGQYRTNVSVDIGSCSEGGYCLTDMDSGEWVTYTIHVPSSDTYHINVRYAAENESGSIRFSFGGINVTADVLLPATGGLSNWSTYTVTPSVNLNRGVHAMRVYITGVSDSFNLNWITINQGPGAEPTSTPLVLLGDVDSSSTVNIIDALLVAQYYVGLNPDNFNLAAGDVDCNNSVTIGDALLIA